MTSRPGRTVFTVTLPAEPGSGTQPAETATTTSSVQQAGVERAGAAP